MYINGFFLIEVVIYNIMEKIIHNSQKDTASIGASLKHFASFKQ